MSDTREVLERVREKIGEHIRKCREDLHGAKSHMVARIDGERDGLTLARFEVEQELAALDTLGEEEK